MSTSTDKLILRTSDRKLFRTCRTKWDFSSKIRQNYEYVPGVEALDFGTAIHAAMEIYYDPQRWQDDRLIVQNEAVIAFTDHMNDWRSRLKRAEQWDLKREAWFDLSAQGIGMLHHYFSWAPAHDIIWEPVKVEIEFEVPIPVPIQAIPNNGLPRRFSRDSEDGSLHYLASDKDKNITGWVPVVYQGRIDLIMRNKQTDRIWVWDHKTRAKFDSYDYYELDTQCSSYVWALKKIMNLDVAGVIFQDMRKKVPEKPKLLQKGGLSKNKAQNTTLELYKAAITEYGLDPSQYTEFLEWLADNEQEYFRRIQVDRNPAELEITGLHVLNEALDMFDSPRIYPNPDAFNCNSCQFKEPCIMRQDGSDWKWQLEHSNLYEKRS